MLQHPLLTVLRCCVRRRLLPLSDLYCSIRTCRLSTFLRQRKEGHSFKITESVLVSRTVQSHELRVSLHNSSSTVFHRRSLCEVISWKPSLVTMKLDTPAFHALLTPELLKLAKLFEHHGYELRIAGGAVRDLLLNKTSDDVDLATTATPAQMKKMFEQERIRILNTSGEKHGTITCRIDDKVNFEVTTLRIDVLTDGRHADVQFTRDWEQDALRRDLTINSMFLGFDGTVYDYFNGIADLDDRRVRFVGDATSRIQEDYLRILRYFRFFGRISTNPEGHEQNVLRAIKENLHGLNGISGERIWVELKKITTGRYASHVITTMMELGLGKYIGLGEDPDTAEFRKIYDRCHDLEPKPLTLIPALLKDENQLYKFHERVKLSKEELRTGLFIMQHRDDDLGPDPFHYCKDLHCDAILKDVRCKDRILELLKHLGQHETLQHFQSWTPPKFPVSGHKLMALGIKRQQMSKVISALREEWKKSDYALTEEELLQHLDKLEKKN